MFHNSKCTRTTQYHCFFSRRHGINGHLRSLCYGRKWKCTETTVKRLVSYSQYGAPGKPGNPLFYFLCTKREFPFQSIHHDRAKCGPSPHYELDQCGKQQPHSIRTIRLELERAHSSGYDLSLFVNSTLAVSNIRNRTYTDYEVYLIDYGYGNFKEKIHFME